jgi:hypothetical protein
MGFEEVVTAAQSPWQNRYAENFPTISTSRVGASFRVDSRSLISSFQSGMSVCYELFRLESAHS